MELALFSLIGLHVPRSYILLYALLLVLAFKSRVPLMVPADSKVHALFLLLFGITYALLSLWHGLWLFQGRDILDLVSIVVLPASCYLIGERAAQSFGWEKITKWLIAYGLGAFFYALVTLLFSRGTLVGEPFYALWTASKSSALTIPWSSQIVNVRTIEQNVLFASAWLCSGLVMYLGTTRYSTAFLLTFTGILSLLAGYCFKGRLVYLACILGALPYLGILSARLTNRVPFRFFTLCSLLVSTAMYLLISNLFDFRDRLIRAIYDERFDLYLGFWGSWLQFPLGGNHLRYEWLHYRTGKVWLFDASGSMDVEKTVGSMHNVFLDIYVRVGFLPLFLLICALCPIVWHVLQALITGLRTQHLVVPAAISTAAFGCFLVLWTLQPLLYSDGLMFFVAFLFLGAVAGRRSSFNR